MKRSMMVVMTLALSALILTAGLLWAQEDPGARFGHSMVTLDDDVYLFAGATLEGESLSVENDLWEYSPAANTWTHVLASDPPPERLGHTAGVVDGKMYVFGGTDVRYQPRGDMWVFDSANNTWTQLSTGSVPARTSHSATVVGDQIVIFGGLDESMRPSTDTWVYSTTSGTWTQGQDFPDLGYGDTGAAYNDSVYVLGHTEGQAYVYDVTQDNWSEVPVTGGDSTPEARTLAMGAQTTGTAWILGGEDLMTGMPRDDVWEFDFASQSWHQVQSLPQPLMRSAATVLNATGPAGSVALQSLQDSVLLDVQPSRQGLAGLTQVVPDTVKLLIFGGLQANGFPSAESIIYDTGIPVTPSSSPVLTRIVVEPEDIFLALGQTQPYTATAYDQHGRAMDPPIDVSWTTTGGDISKTGLYTATTAGDFTVQATVQGSVVRGAARVHMGMDSDGDGVRDITEDRAPNQGDGNNDGLVDRLQPEVASIPAETGRGWITLETSCAALYSVNAYVETTRAQDPAFDYPYGLVSFKTSCASATVKMYFHGAYDLAVPTYRQYGPSTPGDPAPAGWYDLAEAGFGTIKMNGQATAYAEFSLVDGQFGDDTGPDGWIVAQGGPAQPTSDFNGDAMVDAVDLAFLADQWLSGAHSSADLDLSGQVDMIDFALFAHNWPGWLE